MVSKTVSTRGNKCGLNRRLSVAGLLVVLAVSGGAARASLFAYDGFDYSLGQTVVGQSGGSGWSGNYTLNTGNDAGAFCEVSDMTASFPELSVSGNQMHLDGSSTPGLSAGVYRNLGTTYNTAGNIYWFSALLQVDNGAGTSYAGISLFSTTVEQFFYGQRNTRSTWGMEQHPGSGANSSVSALNSANSLLVLELNGNTHTASLFVNPLSLGGSAPATPNTTLAFTDFSFNRIRAQAGNENLDVDELRFGSTYADVTPLATPVPEPTALFPAIFLGLIPVYLARRWKRSAPLGPEQRAR